jgi:hypothetical protein
VQVEALELETVPLHPHRPTAQPAEPPDRPLVLVAVQVEALELETVLLHPHHPTAQLAEPPNHPLALAGKPGRAQEPERALGLGRALELVLEHQIAQRAEPPGRL